MMMQGDHEKLQEQEAELRKQFNTAKEDIDGLHADLGRQDNVMQLMEDVLPANSIKVKDSMCDVLKYLTPEQVTFVTCMFATQQHYTLLLQNTE